MLLAKSLSGGFVPVGAALMRGHVFERVFDRMERAFVHGSTFAKNDLAMAAGLATLAVMDEERLIARAADHGERLIQGLRARLAGSDLVKEVRGLGMMIAIELGPPGASKLKAANALVEQASKGLFCQLMLIPLLTRHHILAQVAGYAMPVIKLLPPFVIGADDRLWIEQAFAQVVWDSHDLAGVWDRGRTLAGQALRERAKSA